MLADAAAPTLFVRVPLPIVLAEVMDLAGLRQCRNMIWIPFLISRRGTIKFVSSTRCRFWERAKLIQGGSARVLVCIHQSSFSPPKPEDVDWITRRMKLFHADTIFMSETVCTVSNAQKCRLREQHKPVSHSCLSKCKSCFIDFLFGFLPIISIISFCQSWDPRLDRLFNIVGFVLRPKTFSPLSRMPWSAQRAESRLYS